MFLPPLPLGSVHAYFKHLINLSGKESHAFCGLSSILSISEFLGSIWCPHEQQEYEAEAQFSALIQDGPELGN